MPQVAKIVASMRESPTNVRFTDLVKVCEHYFGEARQQGTSHRVYKTPWAGDLRVNIQKGQQGKAKAYQVRQVLSAIEKLEGMNSDES
jgi:hypothetical protein